MTPRLSRRAVLGATGAAVVALVLEPAGVAAAATSSGTTLDRLAFTPAVGQVVTATGGGRTFRLTLAAVRDLSPRLAGSRTNFALVFSSAGDVPDGIYTLSNPRFGRRSLFVSGVGTSAGRRYEAVISRTG